MKKLAFVLIAVLFLFQQGVAQCPPTFITFTYSFPTLAPGSTVTVTWNSDCPSEPMTLSLIRITPLPYQSVQVVTGIPNSGSYVFTLDASHVSGEYEFYMQDTGGPTVWNYGSHFMIDTDLPVDLIDFVGRSDKDEIQLEWRTASELNNMGFEIEKSNNSRDWETIDFVEGKGTTVDLNRYTYQDAAPLTGMNYYRLKQIDNDESFEYSDVILVENKNLESTMDVYPNPTSQNLNIQIDNPAKENIKVIVRDQLGKIVWESEFINDESNWSEAIQIDQHGVYFVTSQIGNKIKNKRIVVME